MSVVAIGAIGILGQTPGATPVDSVTVTPSTFSIAAAATQQLTATVRDAQSNVLTSRTVTWASANESIATVSSSGLVTGVGAGGPINITATCETVEGTAAATVTASGATAAFEDDFESYALGAQPNGSNTVFAWDANSMGGRILVSDNVARAGTKSLQFRWQYEGSFSNTVEVDFHIDDMTEYWLEFYLYYPDGTEGFGSIAYSQPPNNAKFHTWWTANGYSPEPAGNFSMVGGSGNGYIDVRRHLGNDGFNDQIVSAGELFFVAATDRARWIRVRLQLKQATHGVSNGLFRAWKDDTLVFELLNEPFYEEFDTTTAPFSEGSLIGATNNGTTPFAGETHIYMDDFKFYTSDPGW